MKYLRWLLPLYIAAFPYLCFAGLYMEQMQAIFPGHPFRLVGIFWLAGLAAALAAFFTRNRWTARELARANMLIKLLHIPAYVFWFAAGILFFLFMGALLAVLMDALAISLSGLFGLAAVLRCGREGGLTGGRVILHGVLQFIFCADVFSAVSVYRGVRRNST